MAAEVVMPDGTTRTVSKLLTSYAKPVKISERYALEHPGWASWWLRRGNAGGNTKQSHGKEFVSIGLSLAPNTESGHNVCPKSTPGCREACVFHGGIAGAFSQIRPSQVAKTRLFFQNRKVFDQMLLTELQTYAAKFPETLVCRLNVYSDISWETVCPWIFELVPSIRHYDYSKRVDRVLKFLKGDFPPNYHLTFSRSETNEDECHQVLAAGGTVAVVFPRHQEPKTFWNYPVISGDANDLRLLEKGPAIISLYAKNVRGRRDTTGFVVRLPQVNQ